MPLTIPNKESDNKNSAPIQTVDDDLNKQYIDKRYVTISLVHNYSNYRKVNMKTMGHKRETIGSSIRSCQVLSSNAEEVATYFPALIGVSANNSDFLSRVKGWLSNIQFAVNNEDEKLNVTFIYNTKKDYLDIKKKEDAIEEEYAKVNRADESAIREALKRKIDALNTLEGSKYKVGHPEDVEQYLIYRHCLLYKDVAKDTALINSDPNVRFYIKDEQREAERQKKLINERVKAMKAFIDVSSTDAKFEAVFIAVTIMTGANLGEAMLKDRNQKNSILMDFVNSNPDKFNKIVNDKNVQIKAFIETLILRGELIRSDFNQQISTADGTFIGANMNEAITWFNNPANNEVRKAYENKIKLT